MLNIFATFPEKSQFFKFIISRKWKINLTNYKHSMANMSKAPNVFPFYDTFKGGSLAENTAVYNDKYIFFTDIVAMMKFSRKNRFFFVKIHF